MKKQNVLIIGVTSSIAYESAKIYAANNANLFLTGRDLEKLNKIEQDLIKRGATIISSTLLDITNFNSFEDFLIKVKEKFSTIDILLFAPGFLGIQVESENSNLKALEVVNTNYTGPLLLLNHIAKIFEKQKSGTIAVISSVAGDRGRKSNYIYGSAKAGLTAYLSGLRNRLYEFNVTVITLNPGLTLTPMNHHLQKGTLFWTSAEVVGKEIVNAIEKRKDVAYLPRYWFFIMFIIKLIPERVFKKLSL